MVDNNRVKQILEELEIKEFNHIKPIREKLGLSVEELANLCSISSGEISMVENQLRIPNQAVIIKIARGFKKLGVHPHKVFTFF